MGTDSRRSGYGVKLVRGPFVRLPPHPDAYDDEQGFLAWATDLRQAGYRLAADLFCGAGGLSLGLQEAGWRVVISADHDTEALETHRHLFGGLSLDWDLSDSDRVEKLAGLVADAGIELLAGGPPCQPFSKAGRYMIRDRVRRGLRDPHDERRDLWRSFLEVVRLARPPAVVMENVPDMALDKEMFILRAMVHELESLGYAVGERVLETRRYGVPQFRQRLILVALTDGLEFEWPAEEPEQVTLWNAIGDLPEVEGGWRPEGGADGWAVYDEPVTRFQQRMRARVLPAHTHRVYDHITRPVRDDDARAFELMDADTRYSQLPEEYKRYRDDIFVDKYKRLEENGPSRTITAHIAKDGYWYIHPRQNRTLTVREAARLQTFPDHIRFAGPPSAAFRQIGNAVPPRVGEHLGTAVIEALATARPAPATTQQVADLLADWFNTNADPVLPWLRARTRWQVVAAETLLDRVAPWQTRYLWPLMRRWVTPADTLAGEKDLSEVASWIDRQHRAQRIIEVARWLEKYPDYLDDDDTARTVPGVTEAVADLAVLAAPAADDRAEEPVLVTKGVLRVAARFTGSPVDRHNQLTQGRLAVARMIGEGGNAREAHLGLIELANSLCAPTDPYCTACPLQKLCSYAGRNPGKHLLF